MRKFGLRIPRFSTPTSSGRSDLGLPTSGRKTVQNDPNGLDRNWWVHEFSGTIAYGPSSFIRSRLRTSESCFMDKHFGSLFFSSPLCSMWSDEASSPLADRFLFHDLLCSGKFGFSFYVRKNLIFIKCLVRSKPSSLGLRGSRSDLLYLSPQPHYSLSHNKTNEPYFQKLDLSS